MQTNIHSPTKVIRCFFTLTRMDFPTCLLRVTTTVMKYKIGNPEIDKSYENKPLEVRSQMTKLSIIFAKEAELSTIAVAF